MESAGVVSGESWSSYISSMPSEEPDIMVHFLGTYPFQSEQDHQDLGLATPSFFWSDQAANSYYYSDNANSNVYNWSQGDGSSSGISISSSTTTDSFIVPPPPYESCYYLNDANPPFGINTYSAPLEFSLMNDQRKDPSISVVPNPSFGDLNCVNDETSSDDREDSCLNLSECAPPKRKSNVSKEENVVEHDKLDTPAQSSKKKARSSAQVQKCAKRAQTKRTQKSIRSGDEESNATLNGQSSSCYSSDNDSNGSQDMNGGGSTSSSSKSSAALNLNGKTRAGRGSATDPQSLYARKRRERINERLKVLQNLVPNGTKVDISTMLEEAVQYVKFLQVQIKLLSSDELWMYAPIAYNGMNIGFDLKTSPRQQK
ncbi:uncharacterized protein [Typha latifolia]|uniref:uncharacterized protein n=1 Tax=Typha latifolia TaxID=4733 RepID=UPI003C2B7320